MVRFKVYVQDFLLYEGFCTAEEIEIRKEKYEESKFRLEVIV